ncbi:hypothetical protein BC567DRAFT_214316 [Phyllosticta citribraziliensis]
MGFRDWGCCEVQCVCLHAFWSVAMFLSAPRPASSEALCFLHAVVWLPAHHAPDSRISSLCLDSLLQDTAAMKASCPRLSPPSQNLRSRHVLATQLFPLPFTPGAVYHPRSPLPARMCASLSALRRLLLYRAARVACVNHVACHDTYCDGEAVEVGGAGEAGNEQTGRERGV